MLFAACRSEGEDGKETPRPSPGQVDTEDPPNTNVAERQPTRLVPALRPDRVPPGTGCVSAACHGEMRDSRHIHGPVAAEDGCFACHDKERPGHLFPLLREGDAVCALCHNVLTGKAFVHAPVGQSGCTSCHDPHVSETKYLLTAATLEASCRACHPASETGEFPHGPYVAGACSACHLPHEADNAKLTIRSGTAHCFRCHTEVQQRVETARTVHEPVVEDCLHCHEAHVARYAKLLTDEPAAQCRACHAKVDELVRTATSKHGAVFTGKQCGNCHDVHGSFQPSLLRAPVMELCLTCHDKPQEAYDGRRIPEMKTKLTASASLHGPVRQGQCQTCHLVHGSTNAALLKRVFPDTFYKDFDLANYALCFSCHEQALVLDKETTTLTGFRNGSRNLHFLHVNRAEKGRTCKACHEIHGSNKPKHIAEAVPFEGGGWAMPLGFSKSETGGSCGPGCHQPYAYDREKPVVYPSDKGEQP